MSTAMLKFLGLPLLARSSTALGDFCGAAALFRSTPTSFAVGTKTYDALVTPRQPRLDRLEIV